MVSFIHIESDRNYYNTDQQVRIKNTSYFVDHAKPSLTTGSTEAGGFFSYKPSVKDKLPYVSTAYPTGSTVKDASGASRKILSTNIDFFASSSLDYYKNGIEIREDKHWTAGLSKITAGTPGHLLENYAFGVSDSSIIDPDKYIEIDVFDPVNFVEVGDPNLFTYPIITSDANQTENYILNGIIEPFPIRPVISNFSINFPFEPHSYSGQFGNGNTARNRDVSSDQVMSVDYYTPKVKNRSVYLDAVETIMLSNSDSTVTASVGASNGYIMTDFNALQPFEDVIHLIDEFPSGSRSSGQGLFSLLERRQPNGEETYVSKKQKSATAGFVYDNAEAGTDSIAYGGLLY